MGFLQKFFILFYLQNCYLDSTHGSSLSLPSLEAEEDSGSVEISAGKPKGRSFVGRLSPPLPVPLPLSSSDSSSSSSLSPSSSSISPASSSPFAFASRSSSLIISSEAQTSLSTFLSSSSTNGVKNVSDVKTSLLQTIDEITRGSFCVPTVTSGISGGPLGFNGGLNSAVESLLLPTDYLEPPGLSTKTNGGHRIVFISPLDVSLQIPTAAIREKYRLTTTRIDFLSGLLAKYNPKSDGFGVFRRAIHELTLLEKDVYQARIAWLKEDPVGSANSAEDGVGSDEIRKNGYLRAEAFFEWEKKTRTIREYSHTNISKSKPWLYLAIGSNSFIEVLKDGKHTYKLPEMTDLQSEPELRYFSNWTTAYFSCDSKLWLFSYTSLIVFYDRKNSVFSLKALISVDLNINNMDVNQCDSKENLDTDGETDKDSAESTLHLFGTHKCHRESSQCVFARGHGWRKGGYTCRCRDGFYTEVKEGGAAIIFNGSEVESAWIDKIMGNAYKYNLMYTCKACADGCEKCIDASPCLSTYDWAFRIALLTISILCIFLTIVLACYIYKYRKLKVFKVASPIFLCITLLGCAIMYSEMAAIFPVLDSFWCILTKITRHMGFCITYSALLLKTWRVSLTYRVKSAHKLKLTDKQLLQWLFPILLVMAIYLGTWIISAPPHAIYIEDWNGLKFKICVYNWWDHSIVIGEFLFLLWGIKVCYSVRNAESFFNEAKYITWAIYNIAIVNILMIFIHISILPNAGADIKYFFGFVRTQLSTTTTVMLIFGPKFYRVLKGQGDSWDNRVRARGVNASFSLNGVGLVHEETSDLYQENEELKEEIHKLATQIELMKLMQMEMNNRHLKSKHGTATHHPTPTVTITTNPASTTNATQSPIVKAAYSRFDTNDGPSPRISPAAELVSERV